MERELLIYLFTVVLPYYTLPLGIGLHTVCYGCAPKAPLHGLGVGI